MSKVFTKITSQQCYDRSLEMIKGEVNYDEDGCLRLTSVLKRLSGNNEEQKEDKENGIDRKSDDEYWKGCTLLHFACGYGHSNIVTLLIKNEASIDIVDNDG